MSKILLPLMFLLLAIMSAEAARDISQTDRSLPFGSLENVFDVVLETTQGNLVLEVHPEWSPIGAEHFRELVNAGYYDGAPWFRVIKGFVAQCGIAADPEMTAQWQDQLIPDERVVMGNKRGFVSYGKTSDPDSRSTHIFINYGNNSRLDNIGFSAFAVVREGMEVADSLHITDENPPDTQDRLTELGSPYFADLYPDGDYIVKAYIVSEITQPKSCCGKSTS